MIEKKLLGGSAFLLMILVILSSTLSGATNEKVALRKPPLYHSVNTYCYLPGYINAKPTHDDSILCKWWVDHFDFIIQSDLNSRKQILAISPNITQVTYGIVGGMTAYNRQTDGSSLIMDTLKKWVYSNYSNYGFSSPDSAFESCFMHANQQVIINFSMGGIDTIPQYSTSNPKKSRLPGTWQQNSDFIMNIKSLVYQDFWIKYWEPIGAIGYDGYMFDVYGYPSEKVFVAYGDTGQPTKAKEFVSGGDYQRNLASFTQLLRSKMNSSDPKKYLGMNSADFQTGSSDTFQFVKYFDFILREMDCAFGGAYVGSIGGALRGTVSAANMGTAILFQHNQSMDTRFDKAMTTTSIVARDRIAGLSAYLMAKSNNTYFFTYPGQWYGNDKRTTSWFNAMAYDIGQPVGQYYTFATGNDPSSTTPYIVLARKFDKALVLFKPKYAWNDTIYDSRSATTHDLGGKYRLLNADSTLGSPITSISLKNWEGAILIPSKSDNTKEVFPKTETTAPHVRPILTAGKVPVLRMTISNIASLEILIYDISGKLVDSQSIASPTTNKISGNNAYFDFKCTKAKAVGTYNATIHAKTFEGKVIDLHSQFTVMK